MFRRYPNPAYRYARYLFARSRTEELLACSRSGLAVAITTPKTFCIGRVSRCPYETLGPRLDRFLAIDFTGQGLCNSSGTRPGEEYDKKRNELADEYQAHHPKQKPRIGVMDAKE